MPVLRSDQQQLSSSPLERLNHSSYESQFVTCTTNSGSFSIGMRDGVVSQSNFNTTPTISAAMSIVLLRPVETCPLFLIDMDP